MYRARISIMSKENDSSSTAKSSKAVNLYETINQNITRVVDEVAKAQPQYLQSISNLQLDYIQAVKNTVENTMTAQKQIAVNRAFNWDIPFAANYTEQLTNQTNEITNNVVKAVQVNNQLTVNALDAARDNIRIFNRAADAVLEFNNNATKACAFFFSAIPQPQQFFKL
jgi:hypothetical protein